MMTKRDKNKIKKVLENIYLHLNKDEYPFVMNEDEYKNFLEVVNIFGVDCDNKKKIRSPKEFCFEYNDKTFNSELDARWAIYLTEIGWKWEYVPAMEFKFEERYVIYPSFLIRCPEALEEDFLIIVSKHALTPDETDSAIKICIASKFNIVFAIGKPDPKNITCGLDGAVFRNHGCINEGENEDINEYVICENCFSICSYCFEKWGRPGALMMYDGSDQEEGTIKACEIANSFKFKRKKSNA